MEETTMITSLIDEYSGLYERHMKLLKMIQKIIPLLDKMEDSKEKSKIVRILVNTGNRLIEDMVKEERED